MRWAIEMEPIFSMGLKSPMREDMPAATMTAPICTQNTFLLLGNTAQSAFGISWKICALISSLFLEVHNTIRFAHMHKFALAKSKIWTLT